MMHAVAFVTPSTFAAFGSRVPKRKSRRQSSRIVARAAECKRDAAVVSPVLSRSRRGVLFTGLAAVWAWTTPRAEAAAPPPTPDASNSAYIQSLLAKTEANKDRRALEQQNKYCLRQSQMGVGDCAGLPEEDLKMAMDESLVRFERKKAAAEAAAAEAAAAEAAAAEVDANIQ